MTKPARSFERTRYVHHLAVEWPAATETIADARQRLAAKFPRHATRRMTHLGLLLGSVLDGVVAGLDDAIVYATTFAETRALEEYLASFPAPSPALFQSSIHPSAVQQVMIGRQQSIGRVWPLAADRRLFEQALLTALLEPAERVLVCGGEERGTWMLDHGVASDRSFAFVMALTRQPNGAIGRVGFDSGMRSTEGVPPGLVDAAKQLAARATIEWSGPQGSFSIAFTS